MAGRKVSNLARHKIVGKREPLAIDVKVAHTEKEAKITPNQGAKNPDFERTEKYR